MTRYFPFVTVLLPLLLSVSCQREQEAPDCLQTGCPDVFHVCISLPEAGEGETRTMLGGLSAGIYPTLWSEGDRISVEGVFSEPLSAEQASVRQASFTFQGAMSAPYNYLYPATKEADIVCFPSFQTYVPGTFDPAAMPMWASSISYDGVTMQHLGAVLRFSFSSPSPAVLKKILLMSPGGEPLSGTFRMKKDVSGRFTGEIEPGQVSTIVTMEMPGEGMTVGPAAQDFYLCVPGATYSEGLQIAAYDADGKYMLLRFKSGDDDHTIRTSSLIAFPSTPLSFSDGVRLIASADDWNAFATDINTAVLPVTAQAQIVSDLDFTGKEFVGITSGFKGTINGRKNETENYRFKNLSASGTNRIVGYNASGTISHVDIDASCTYDVPAWDGESTQFFALLCGQNRGTIEHCHAAHAMTFAFPTTNNASYYSGLVGRNHGTVSHCGYSGTMTNRETTSGIPNLAHIIGGVVANNYNTISGWTGPGEVSDCEFSGKILIGPNAGDASSTDCSGPVVSVSSGDTQLCVGGVCGRYATGGSFTGNSSASGSVIDVRGSYYNASIGGVIGYHTQPLNGTETLAIVNRADVTCCTNSLSCGFLAVGGVAGRCENSLSQVANYGSIVLVTDQAEVKTASRCGVGGIAGTLAVTAVRTVENSLNAGQVKIINVSTIGPTLSNDSMRKWSCGGIVGYMSSPGSILACENRGDIELNYRKAQAGSKYRLTYTGGVAGLVDGVAARIESCTNAGEVLVNAFSNYGGTVGQIQQAPYGGGIVGGIIGKSLSERASVLDCTVAGSKSLTFYRSIMGGIAGYASFAAIGAAEKPCTVTMPVIGESGSRVFAGGVVGAAENTEVSHCRFTATMTGVAKPAGVVGLLSKAGSIKDCIVNATITVDGASAHRRDPMGIVSLINASYDDPTQASHFNITRCGIAGTIAGMPVTAANVSSFICNLYDGSNTQGSSCKPFTYTPYQTDDGQSAAYLYSE